MAKEKMKRKEITKTVRCPYCGEEVTEYMLEKHHQRDDLFTPKNRYPTVKICANCHKKITIEQRRSWGWRRRTLTMIEEEEPCEICGYIGVENHHIIPKSKGGSGAVNNLEGFEKPFIENSL